MDHNIRTRTRTRASVIGVAVALSGLATTLGPAQAAPIENLPIQPVGYNLVNGAPDLQNPLRINDLTSDPGYDSTASSNGTAGAARSVIGTDGRNRVQDTTAAPYRRSGQLESNGRLHCTAWMISARTAVTAGHCIKQSSFYNNLEFFPGRDGVSTNPYGSFKPTQIWIDERGLNKGGDWAVLQFDEPIGNTVGWYGLAPKAANQFAGLDASVIGYPGDKPGGTMWEDTDVIDSATDRQVFYKTDTAGGQSGSAVTTDNRNVANAIHTNGTWDSTNGSNSGTRLTGELFNTLAQLRR